MSFTLVSILLLLLVADTSRSEAVGADTAVSTAEENNTSGEEENPTVMRILGKSSKKSKKSKDSKSRKKKKKKSGSSSSSSNKKSNVFKKKSKSESESDSESKSKKKSKTKSMKSSEGSASSGTDNGSMEKSSPTMDAIRERGFLVCGINGFSPGFSQLNMDTNQWEGLDISLCRAIAAIVLDDVEAVSYELVTSAERFVGLANKEIDMLARTTTHTIQRDVNEPSTGVGFTFTTPYFYTGVGFGGIPPFGECADNLDTEGDCAELMICAIEDTTSIAAVRRLFAEEYIVATDDTLEQGLNEGICNAIASDQSLITEFSVAERGIYTGEYEAGSNIFSKDPLAMVSREDDQAWSDLLFWTLQALISAEELGIDRSGSGEFPLFDGLEPYGLDSELFQRAIGAVGNYGEIYEEYLEDVVPRSGTLNGLNEDNCPQHYALF